MGKDLKSEEEELSRQWQVNEVNENFVVLMINFMAQASPFPKSYFTYNVRNNVEPHVWRSSLTVVDKKFTTFVSDFTIMCREHPLVDKPSKKNKLHRLPE